MDRRLTALFLVFTLSMVQMSNVYASKQEETGLQQLIEEVDDDVGSENTEDGSESLTQEDVEKEENSSEGLEGEAGETVEKSGDEVKSQEDEVKSQGDDILTVSSGDSILPESTPETLPSSEEQSNLVIFNEDNGVITYIISKSNAVEEDTSYEEEVASSEEVDSEEDAGEVNNEIVYASYDITSNSLLIFGNGTIDYNYTEEGSQGIFSTLINQLSPELKQVTFSSDTGIVSLVGNCSYLFTNCKNLESIEGYVNTVDVTNISNMFSNCTNLISVDASTWDFSNLESADDTFLNCVSLNIFKTPYTCNNIEISLPFTFVNISTLEEYDVIGNDVEEDSVEEDSVEDNSVSDSTTEEVYSDSIEDSIMLLSLESDTPSSGTDSMELRRYYQNTYLTYLNGFEKSEGDSKDGKALKLSKIVQDSYYGNTFTLENSDYISSMPNGFYGNGFITSDNSEEQPFNTTITQGESDITFEINYYPVTYSIEYDTQGGTNDTDNKTEYNVLYSVRVYSARQDGHYFSGWVNEDNVVVTRINGSTSNSFSSIDELYKDLASRTARNIKLTATYDLTAHYTKYNFYAIYYDDNGNEKSIQLGSSTTVKTYEGTKFMPESDLLSKVPNGYELSDTFKANRTTYSFGDAVSQNKDDIIISYYYYPIKYSITYITEGEAPSTNTYTILDTLELEPATKDGYTFVNWYKVDNTEESLDESGGEASDYDFETMESIEFTNIDPVTSFTSSDSFYTAMQSRLAENLTLISEMHETVINIFNYYVYGFRSEDDITTGTFLDTIETPSYNTESFAISDRYLEAPNGFEAKAVNHQTGETIADNEIITETLDPMEFDISYYPITYKITYDLNDGIMPDGTTNPETYTVLDYIVLNPADKENMAFKGWRDQTHYVMSTINTEEMGDWSTREELYNLLSTRKVGNISLLARFELKETHYTITVPKVINITSSTKETEYTVGVDGLIKDGQAVVVIPDSSFELTQNNKPNATATVTQSKTNWTNDDLGTSVTGSIKAEGLTGGKWSSSMNFIISFVDGTEAASDEEDETDTGIEIITFGMQ